MNKLKTTASARLVFKKFKLIHGKALSPIYFFTFLKYG
jgi:hypothetical protein